MRRPKYLHGMLLFLMVLLFSNQANAQTKCNDLWEEPEYKKWVELPERDYQPLHLEQLLERCDNNSGRYYYVTGFLINIYRNLRMSSKALNRLEFHLGRLGSKVSSIDDKRFFLLIEYLPTIYADLKTWEESILTVKYIESLWEAENTSLSFYYLLQRLKNSIWNRFLIENLNITPEDVNAYLERELLKTALSFNEENVFPDLNQPRCSLPFQYSGEYTLALRAQYYLDVEYIKKVLLPIKNEHPGTHCVTDTNRMIAETYEALFDIQMAIYWHELSELDHANGRSINGSFSRRRAFIGVLYHEIGNIDKARFFYLRYFYFYNGSDPLYSMFIRLKELNANKKPFDPDFLLQLENN